MSFGEQIRLRRSELRLTRVELAERLGVSPSAVSNYENGLSFPKEDVMLRLFDCLETEPNVLFRDSYREGGRSLSASEQALLRQYRGLSLKGSGMRNNSAAAALAAQYFPADVVFSPSISPVFSQLSVSIAMRFLVHGRPQPEKNEA